MASSKSSEYETLYRQFQPELLSFARYYVRDLDDAMEIVNDVFVIIWQKKNELNFDKELRSYLYTSVKNRCFNFLKKNKIDTTDIDMVVDQAHDNTASEMVEGKDRSRHVQQILSLLPTRCKQVFLLSRLSGFSNKEIAELLDISVKTVENQMTKALKIFRKNLKIE